MSNPAEVQGGAAAPQSKSPIVSRWRGLRPAALLTVTRLETSSIVAGDDEGGINVWSPADSPLDPELRSALLERQAILHYLLHHERTAADEGSNPHLLLRLCESFLVVAEDWRRGRSRTAIRATTIADFAEDCRAAADRAGFHAPVLTEFYAETRVELFETDEWIPEKALGSLWIALEAARSLRRGAVRLIELGLTHASQASPIAESGLGSGATRADEPDPQLEPLSDVERDVLRHLISCGTYQTAQTIADSNEHSHSLNPIRAALRCLCELGLVKRKGARGGFAATTQGLRRNLGGAMRGR